MSHNKTRRCPACRQAELQETTYVREFRPQGEVLRVELLTSKCADCGATATTSAQHDENLKRLKARKAQYGGLLLGEEIFSLRRRYGITQQTAAKLFGKGKIAFSRYENEKSYPDESTTRLLELAMEKPDVIRWLADKADVELPLWEARCEDERRSRVRLMTDVRKAGVGAGRWLEVGEKHPAHGSIPLGMVRRWTSNALEQSTSVLATNDDHYSTKQAAFA